MIPPPNKNPSETHLGGSISEGLDSKEVLEKRLSRYSKAHSRSKEMVAHLEAEVASPQGLFPPEALRKMKVRLDECGNYLVFRNYFTVGEVRLSKASFCKQHHICPLCAIRRGTKLLASYIERYRQIQEVNKPKYTSLITITVQNGEDLDERFSHLQKNMKKLLANRRRALSGGRHKTEFSKILGGAGSYEFTNIGNGWHPHVHIVVVHDEPINEYDLATEWKFLTKDSYILDVSPLRNPDDPAKDFMEVFKYAVKFSDLSLADNLLAYSILKNKRLLFSFGLFWGIKPPDELTDDLLKDLPYIELFYQYFEGRYQLDYESPVKLDE